MNQGLFIVLEGSDGSGKATQLKILQERLKAVGYEVEVFDFPQYEQDSSYFVRQYLGGEYGPASEVNPYTASLFYALDRFEASPKIKTALEDGKIVLSNRYVGANMAHQGSKFTNEGEQRGFFIWEDGLEYNLLGIPRPNLTFYLRFPAEVSIRLIQSRSIKTGQKLDEHEKNLDHLKKTVATYDLLTKLFPKDFKSIECTKNNRPLPVAEINDKIWNLVKPILPSQPPNKAKARFIKLEAVQKQRKRTDVTKKSNSTKTARVDYQGQTKVFNLKNISRLAASIIESSGGINLEKKDHNHSSNFAINGLPKELGTKYKDSLSKISELKKQIDAELKKTSRKMTKVRKIKEEHKRVTLAITPLAELIDISFEATETKIKEIINRLGLYQLDELNFIASQLSVAARKVWPESPEYRQEFVSMDEPEHLRNSLSEIASRLLPSNLSSTTEAVTMIKASPRNELELITEKLYQYANVGESDVITELDNLSYEKKSEMYNELLIRSELGVADELIYRFDLISDLPTAWEIATKAGANDVKVQLPTPRYGFDVDPALGDAELVDKFNECFDISLGLFSRFQAAEKHAEASYTCLYGHKLRWQLTISASSLVNLELSVATPSAVHLVSKMVEVAGESHPLTIGYLLKVKNDQISSHDRKPSNATSESERLQQRL